MERISPDQAKDRLDELLQRAAAGEDIVISDVRSGDIRLLPISSKASPLPRRMRGRWKGRIHIPDEKLLEPLTAEELAWMSGEDDP